MDAAREKANQGLNEFRVDFAPLYPFDERRKSDGEEGKRREEKACTIRIIPYS